jgi:hypothetical protein
MKHVNVFRIGNKLQTTVSATQNTTIPDELRYDFNYTVPFSSQYKCTWNFGDGTTATTYTASHVFQTGMSRVQLTLVDLNSHDTCISYYQINAGQPCHANYKASFQPVVNTRLYSTATILLTDRDGTVYSSHDTIQPPSSYFELMGVNDYRTNNAGEPTKKLNLKFNCVVKNGARSINLANGTAVIAVAYKK